MATATNDSYTAASGGTIYAGTSASYPAWRRGMLNRTWKKVGTLPSSVDPAIDPALNPNYPAQAPWQQTSLFPPFIGAWNGGAYNTTTDDLWLHGGGHSDYAGNEILGILMNVDSPTWRLVHAPTGATGNTGTLADGLEAGGLYFDGRPRSTHSYNTMCFAGSTFWRMPAPFVFENPNLGPKKFFKYESGDWTSLGDAPFTPGGTNSAAYDSSRGRICFTDSQTNTPRYYSIAGNSWTAGSLFLNTSAYTRTIYIPTLDINVIVNEGGTYKFVVDDFGVTTTGANLPAPPATGTPPTTLYHTGVWVAALGCVVMWNGGTGFDTLTPPASSPATGTWAWGRLEAGGANAVTPDAPTTTGVYGRFFYSPTLNCFGVITAVDKQINVFALDS